MQPLEYHSGQQQIQTEANTLEIAERLSRWVGPAQHFCQLADLFIFATRSASGNLMLSALSGAPPLVQVRRAGGFSLILPDRLRAHLPLNQQVGSLAINLSQARRVRINGTCCENPLGLELAANEVFTPGRKYMSPSAKLDGMRMVGPAVVKKLPLDHPTIASMLAGSETAFLASMSPDGRLDVSHRGGLPGFISYDRHTHLLSWNEYVGDGIFKSAGNIRSTGIFSLLVLHHPSGDGVLLQGQAGYTNLRSDRRMHAGPRRQYQEPFPVQGEVCSTIESALYLSRLTHPRLQLQRSPTVTALSSPREQAPQ